MGRIDNLIVCVRKVFVVVVGHGDEGVVWVIVFFYRPRLLLVHICPTVTGYSKDVHILLEP